MRVLLVEDDAQLGKAVKIGLEQQGYAVDWLRDGNSAETAAQVNEYAAVLLDLGLPGQDGMTLLQKMRQRRFTGPVLIITARDEIPDRIMGLDAGADDFIVKPFDLGELGARLRAATRRAAGRTQSAITHGDIRVDPAARMVTVAGKPVALTAREFALLLWLLEQRGRVQTRAQLQEALYNWATDIESNTVEVHVHHLRRKLGKDVIRTVHGLGYMIDTAPAPTDPEPTG
jgi:two-component system OmpR family response regulator/two-component system response regulator QseB